MISTVKNKKTKVVKVQVLALDQVKTFQIELPTGASRITAITVTSSL